LTDPELRIPVHLHDQIWEAVAAASGDPCFGLRLSRLIDLDGFHVVGHIAATRRDVAAALAGIVGFSRLLHDAGRTEVEQDAGSVWIYPGCRGLPTAPNRHVAEFNVGSSLVLLRLLTGRAVVPQAVWFAHAPPDPQSLSPYLDFFGVMPGFFATETAIVLPADILTWPTRTRGTTGLQRHLEAYATELMTHLADPDDLLDRTRVEVARAVHAGEHDLEKVARKLAMSPRTLQRRLAEQGTTFAEVVDQTRRTLALRHVQDRKLALAEISYLLGFSDPSNFHRAFRRWTGLTPTEYVRSVPPRP
jgi:AraC-like DNA-binding protein